MKHIILATMLALAVGCAKEAPLPAFAYPCNMFYAPSEDQFSEAETTYSAERLGRTSCFVDKESECKFFQEAYAAVESYQDAIDAALTLPTVAEQCSAMYELYIYRFTNGQRGTP